MSKEVTPSAFRLSHVGIQSYDVKLLRDWYCVVLNAEIVHEELPDFCLIATDEEHHRIAFGGLQGERRKNHPTGPGIMHSAFAIGTVKEWLLNYERIRDLGIKPVFVLHHGTSLSTYYNDPDGNSCEIFVDKFATGAEAKAYFRGPVFGHTLGVSDLLDPDAMLARMRAGATDEELFFHDEAEALKMDRRAVLAKVLGSLAGEGSKG